MKTGIELIREERERQVKVEGWDALHDSQHDKGELALVGALYATPVPLFKKIDGGEDGGVCFIDPWPWFDEENYDRYNDGGVNHRVKAWDKRKKHPRLRQLVIAGALIAAEIDRIQRWERAVKVMESVP